MKRYLFLAAAGLATATLFASIAACTAPTAYTPAPPLPAASSGVPAATQAPAPASGDGFIAKKLGQIAGLGGNTSKPIEDAPFTFAIDKISVDPKCQFGTITAGKHVLEVSFRISVGAMTSEDLGYAEGLVNPYSLQTVGPDGVSHPASPTLCTGDSPLPSTYSPHSKYVGIMEIETADASGLLRMVSAETSHGSGWEWAF